MKFRMARYPDATSCIDVVFFGDRFVTGLRRPSLDAVGRLNGCIAVFGISIVSCRTGHQLLQPVAKLRLTRATRDAVACRNTNSCYAKGEAATPH